MEKINFKWIYAVSLGTAFAILIPPIHLTHAETCSPETSINKLEEIKNKFLSIKQTIDADPKLKTLRLRARKKSVNDKATIDFNKQWHEVVQEQLQKKGMDEPFNFINDCQGNLREISKEYSILKSELQSTKSKSKDSDEYMDSLYKKVTKEIASLVEKKDVDKVGKSVEVSNGQITQVFSIAATILSSLSLGLLLFYVMPRLRKLEGEESRKTSIELINFDLVDRMIKQEKQR